MEAIRIHPRISIVASGGLGLTHSKDCHVYLIESDSHCILIDSGAGITSSRISNTISSAVGGRRLKAILLTHRHADHSGGAASLQRQFECEVWCSEAERYAVESGDERALGLSAARKSGRYPTEYLYSSPTISHVVRDRDTMHVGDIKLTVMLTPGHSAGSIAIYAQLPDDRTALFTGDTLFAGGFISLLNTPDSSLESYRKSILRLASLKVDMLLPGHHLFALRGGWEHIRQANDRFAGSVLPPNYPTSQY